MSTTTFSSEERSTNAVAVESEVGHVAIGLLGTCRECQSQHAATPREFYSGVHETQEIFDEGHFSWSQCDLCGSHFGGDRFAAHASQEVGGKWTHTHLDVCADCLFALANGEDYPDES